MSLTRRLDRLGELVRDIPEAKSIVFDLKVWANEGMWPEDYEQVPIPKKTDVTISEGVS